METGNSPVKLLWKHLHKNVHLVVRDCYSLIESNHIRVRLCTFLDNFFACCISGYILNILVCLHRRPFVKVFYFYLPEHQS